MEENPFFQEKGPDLAVVDHLEPGQFQGQVRLNLPGITRPVTQEPVKKQIRIGVILGPLDEMGIQTPEFGGMHGESEHIVPAGPRFQSCLGFSTCPAAESGQRLADPNYYNRIAGEFLSHYYPPEGWSRIGGYRNGF